MTRRPVRRDTREHPDSIDTLSTSAILVLHDRLIGRLDPRARARVLRVAREHGWDSTWDDGPLAA